MLVLIVMTSYYINAGVFLLNNNETYSIFVILAYIYLLQVSTHWDFSVYAMVHCAGITYVLLVYLLTLYSLMGLSGLPTLVLGKQVLYFDGPVLLYYLALYTAVAARVSWFSTDQFQAVLLQLGSKLTFFDRFHVAGVAMEPYPAAVQLVCILTYGGLNLLRLSQAGLNSLNSAYGAVCVVSVGASLFLCGLTLRSLWHSRAGLNDYPYSTPTLVLVLYWNLYCFQFVSLYTQFMRQDAQPAEQKVSVSSVVFTVAYAFNYAAALFV